ncbi:hypothetical protein HPP92_006803 [Vanilla planifolia]|uniref:Alcohol dehydrogenase n=1 Tax=Vanilla planifolia TaxID=51239 RepID=A0A835VAM8_VANPL|nr:hypothetical protein HPP92_006803 [Vanilla planifolia]
MNSAARPLSDAMDTDIVRPLRIFANRRCGQRKRRHRGYKQDEGHTAAPASFTVLKNRRGQPAKGGEDGAGRSCGGGLGGRKPLVIEKVEVAPPKAMEGQTPLFPRIFGHEASGIVESVGEGVTDLKEGDHVLPVFTGECKECAHCKSEESNMCDLLRINTDRGVMLSDGKSRFTAKGYQINHFLGTSTFSEYTVVHVGCLAKIDPSAPLDKVCVLSCGISTARKFGVNEFVNPKDYDRPVQEVLIEMTSGGVDPSVECTGNINAMISAFECVHDGWGVAVLVGVPNKDAVFMTKADKCAERRDSERAFFGNYKPRTDIPSVVDMYMRKELELDKFITHRISFSEINKAFDLMLKGEGLRCIINMEE